MLKVNKYEGKTNEEALAKALEELNTTEDRIYCKYIEEKAKLFKAKKVTLEVITKDDVLEYIKEYINVLATNMNMEIHSEVKENDGIITVMLVSDNNPILIGKDGRTLNAIQILLRQAVSINVGENIKINVDVSNYKAKKQRNLEYEIKKIAKSVSKTGIETKLDPMNSYDRRIVHSVVSNFEDLETESFGETPNRYVVIRKK